jgi:hypothetical protein
MKRRFLEISALALALVCAQVLYTSHLRPQEQLQFESSSNNEMPKEQGRGSNLLHMQILGWNITEFFSAINGTKRVNGSGIVENQTVHMQMQQWGQTSTVCSRKSLRIKLQSPVMVVSAFNELMEIQDVVLLSCCADKGYFHYYSTLLALKKINLAPQFFNFIELKIGTQTLGIYLIQVLVSFKCYKSCSISIIRTFPWKQ